MRERESYRELILENIEYDILVQNERLDRDRLDELVELMVDTVCSHREMIRIAGDDYPAEVVKSRFLKLNSSHIEYVLDRMRDNTTYDAVVILDDTGGKYVNFKLEFPKRKDGVHGKK